MCGGRIRKLLLVAAIAAVVAAIVRALRGEPSPQFSTHPSVLGGPSPEPSTPAAPPAAAEPEAGADSDAPPAELEAGDAPVAELPTGEQPAAELAAPPAPSGALASGDEGGALEQVEVVAEGSWVDPVDGACPDGYPIKAKLKSGIFHQPGGLAYDRTKPDRCYATAEAAEADGLRAAKR